MQIDSSGDPTADDAYEEGMDAYLSIEPANETLEAFEMLGQLASMPSDRSDEDAQA